MYFSYFDINSVTTDSQKKGLKKLQKYREQIQEVRHNNDNTKSEYSLVHAQNPFVHDQLDDLRKQFKGIKHFILVGIGGQNLGVDAIHTVLDTGGVKLHMLDTVSAYNLEQLLEQLKSVRSLKHLAVCISSKSGKTAEVLTNAGVLFEALEKKFLKDIYKQTIFISNTGTDFAKVGKRLGVVTVEMPEVVGGRFSVTSEAGLVPMALLGHDTDSYIAGVLDATEEEFESVVAENAVRLHHYIEKNFRSYNFFAFEPRLYKLGAWYRQLIAESIGKEKDRAGKDVKNGFIPTISTPTELHSMGQLYMSGFEGVYTDFVTFDDDKINFKVPKKGVSKTYGKYDMQEVATALYGGVIGAYQERSLPYRSTIFGEDLAYSLGLFMGMRMLETMYVAELMNVDAFNQPNVELYKSKTREILGL